MNKNPIHYNPEAILKCTGVLHKNGNLSLKMKVLGSMTSIVKYHLATDNNIIIIIIVIIPQRFICKL